MERSLIVALLLSLLLGVAGGVLIARYVGLRVEAIVRAVDDIGDGDLSRRAPVAGGKDAFDRLSVRINRMLDRIAGLMDELRLVTDGLAHDLRSPIGRLRSRIERALAVDDEALRDVLLAGVLDEADALTRMLTTVMEITRSEAMTGRERFAPIDPRALVSELAEMYDPLAEEAGVRLRVEADGPMPTFMGHRQLLAQAMSNLVDNALKHGPTGGQVTLSAGSGGPGLVRLGRRRSRTRHRAGRSCRGAAPIRPARYFALDSGGGAGAGARLGGGASPWWPAGARRCGAGARRDDPAAA